MKSSSHFFNDGSVNAPRLSIFLNVDTLLDLRSDSLWFAVDGMPGYDRLRSDGFDGVQLTANAINLAGSSLPHCGCDRINTPEQADSIIARHSESGDLCVTVHAGWGLEDEDESLRIVDAILRASERYRFPVFVETHRATITQDLWRTVQITKKFPEIRFNGDFSHYYCGQELVYGDWSAKLAFMQPIFDRSGFLHGRIASPGCMQVPVDRDLGLRPQQAHGSIDYLAHFKELWTSAMLGFLCTAVPGDVLIFAPELLWGGIYYARMFPDSSTRLVEETDRYEQALLLKELAEICFDEARQLFESSETSGEKVRL